MSWYYAGKYMTLLWHLEKVDIDIFFIGYHTGLMEGKRQKQLQENPSEG